MFRTFGRIAAAAALVASSAAITTFVATAPVSATNTNVTANCSGSGSTQTINNSDTVTITVGAGCGAVLVLDNAGGTTRWTQMFMYISQGAPTGGLSQGDTIVYTAPASGSGSAAIGFMANAQSPPAITFSINFPAAAPRSDSLTDNGDGSMTIDYSPLSGPQSIWVAMYASGSTCPASAPPSPVVGRLYLLAPNTPYNPIGASPVTVTGDYPAMTGNAPYGTTTMPAGSYEACLYFNPGQGGILASALAITLTANAPTTTTTPSTPVTPTITG